MGLTASAKNIEVCTVLTKGHYSDMNDSIWFRAILGNNKMDTNVSGKPD